MGDKSKEKAAKAFAGITPLLGLGGTIAASVPSLRKPPQAERHVSSLPVAAAMTGVAAQGQGVGRGGNFLTALRAGGQLGSQYMQEKARGQFAADTYNIQQDVNRSARLSQFGKDMADTTGQLAVGLVDSANARKAEREATLAQQKAGYIAPAGQPGKGADNALARAYGGPGEAEMGSAPPLQDVIENPYAGQGEALASLQMELDELGKQEVANAAEAQDLSRASLGLPPVDWLKPVAPHIEENTRRMNIAIETADKLGYSLSQVLPGLSRRMGINFMEYINPPINPGFDEEEDVG